MGWLRSRPLWWYAAAGLVSAVLVAVAMWPFGEPEPRQREYRAETACLLTGDQGVAAPEARPVWAGMQDASLATNVKVQYLEVNGPQTPDNARTFLTSLVQSHCDVVLTVGTAPVEAVRAAAAQFPAARFIVFGSAASAPNVSVVEVDDPEVVQWEARKVVAGLAS